MSTARPRARGPRGLALPVLAVGLAGTFLVALGILREPTRAYFAWLAAWASAVSVALGALVLLMIGHVTRARWILPLRPLAESVAASLPLLALLFVPVLLGMDALYPWVPPVHGLEPEVQEKVAAKSAYLDPAFFVVRAVFYLAAWSTLAVLLRRGSLGSQEGAGPGRRERVLSALGLPLVALTLTFASFDWLMSLDVAWFSTIYGLYWFAGGFAAALGVIALAAWWTRRTRREAEPSEHTLPAAAEPDVEARSTDALGKLLLTFVIFWAYISFSQILTYWIGNIPDRIAWYLPRLAGSWGTLAAAVAIGHFGIPFLLLLPRAVRRRRGALAAIGAWLLLMHHLDVYWLVLPELQPDGPRAHWLDAAALAGVGGLCWAYGGWLLGAYPVTEPAEGPPLERRPGG